MSSLGVIMRSFENREGFEEDREIRYERSILLEIAHREEKMGNLEHAAVAYKYADRFKDYLRCMDEAIRVAEADRDYERAAKLAEHFASDDVVKYYRTLARLHKLDSR